MYSVFSIDLIVPISRSAWPISIMRSLPTLLDLSSTSVPSTICRRVISFIMLLRTAVFQVSDDLKRLSSLYLAFSILVTPEKYWIAVSLANGKPVSAAKACSIRYVPNCRRLLWLHNSSCPQASKTRFLVPKKVTKCSKLKFYPTQSIWHDHQCQPRDTIDSCQQINARWWFKSVVDKCFCGVEI